MHEFICTRCGAYWIGRTLETALPRKPETFRAKLRRDVQATNAGGRIHVLGGTHVDDQRGIHPSITRLTRTARDGYLNP